MSKKISELTAAGALTGAEQVEVVQSGASRRTTAQDIANLTPSGIGGSTGSTDNAILRADGTGGSTLQGSTPTISDAGRISNLTDPSSAQDAATKAYVDASSGITNSAANNELMKSNGTNAVASGIFSTTGGNATLGTGLSGASRVITADGSASDVSLNFDAKGLGSITTLKSLSVLGGDATSAILRTSTSTNTVMIPLNLRASTTGTPAAGTGTGLSFSTLGLSGGQEIGSIIESVSTDITNGSEDFDLVFKTMAAGAAAAERIRITSDGRLYGKALHNNSGAISGTANQYIASGTYTPTLTNHTNVSSSTAGVCQYMRVGNVVTVSGNVDVTATAAAATSTILQLSLPVASNFANDYNCGGTGVQVAGTTVCAINGNVTDDRAQLVWLSGTTSSITIHFSFTYLIL